MFTRAIAASYYGTPRTTMDVDIVVRASHRDIGKLIGALRNAGVQHDEHRVQAALDTGFRIATLGDTRTPYSVDLILTGDALEKRAGTIMGLPAYYQTPEALILAKLRMIKATIPRERAMKDMDDVRAIVRYTQVDLDEIRRRAEGETTLPILETML